ncbi:MAG: hypothetical protein R6V19_09580 [Armatimonadota bacterium]
MYEENMDAIDTKLDTLQHLESAPPFCHAFYGYIAGEIAELGQADQEVARGFVEFLNAEISYHHELSTWAELHEVPFDALEALANRRRMSLQTVAENVSMIRTTSVPGSGLKHLILAECYYHQQDTTRTVQELRAAVSCGLDAPLVRFALGYNLYVEAVERYTIVDTEGTCVGIVDHVAFQTGCMEAVAQFEAGVSGSAFDLQLYGWMAQVFESAGMIDAARDLQEKAGDGENKPHKADFSFELSLADEQPDHSHLPPITEAEVEMVGKLLQGTFTVSELRGDDKPDD